MLVFFLLFVALDGWNSFVLSNSFHIILIFPYLWPKPPKKPFRIGLLFNIPRISTSAPVYMPVNRLLLPLSFSIFDFLSYSFYPYQVTTSSVLIFEPPICKWFKNILCILSIIMVAYWPVELYSNSMYWSDDSILHTLTTDPTRSSAAKNVQRKWPPPTESTSGQPNGPSWCGESFSVHYYAYAMGSDHGSRYGVHAAAHWSVHFYIIVFLFSSLAKPRFLNDFLRFIFLHTPHYISVHLWFNLYEFSVIVLSCFFLEHFSEYIILQLRHFLYLSAIFLAILVLFL